MSKPVSFKEGIRKRGGEGPRSFLSEMLNDPPARSTLIKLNLEQVRRYERNPRKFGNPEYEEIRESIRHRGLDQPLIVTQRPGENHYVLKKGGGTRFQALIELWQETKDQRFFVQECLFEPYRDELDIFVGHGVENIKRAQMSYIETALFFLELKQMMEDLSERELSLREICDKINENGFSIDHARLGRYLYASKLYQYIPQSLEAGLGRTTCDDIKKKERTYVLLWQRHSTDQNRFDVLWGEALASCDNPAAFDVFTLQTTIEASMATDLGLDLRQLSAEADLLLQQHHYSTVAKDIDNAYSADPAAGQPVQTASTSVEKIAVQTSSTQRREAVSGPRKEMRDKREPIRTPLSLIHPFPDNRRPARPDITLTQVEEVMSRKTDRSHDVLFESARLIVVWISAIASHFPELDELRSSDDLIVLNDEDSFRFNLVIPRKIDGNHLLDYVLWRQWKAIESPYFDDEPDAPERTKIEIEERFSDFVTYLSVEARLPWVFSDPSCEWIDDLLNQFEGIVRQFHEQRHILHAKKNNTAQAKQGANT